jgi:hypothetical protein
MYYNASRGGHAPGHLRAALIEALEASWTDKRPWWELLEINFDDLAEQAAWDDATAVQRANWLVGQLWNCDDFTPGDISLMGFTRASTYARLARQLKYELRQFESDSGLLDLDSDPTKEGL